MRTMLVPILLVGCARPQATAVVATAPAPNVADTAPPAAAPPPGQTEDELCQPYADAIADWDAQEEAGNHGMNAPGSPSCGVELDDKAFAPTAGWKRIGTNCATSDRHYAPWLCAVALET